MGAIAEPGTYLDQENFKVLLLIAGPTALVQNMSVYARVCMCVLCAAAGPVCVHMPGARQRLVEPGGGCGCPGAP